jgi:hypothetical protein
MAKKVQKPAIKQMFDIKPAFYSIVLDLDFCDDLAKFIKKKKGTGAIAEFGENMKNAVSAYRSGEIDPIAIDAEAKEFAAKADKYVKKVDKQVKLAAAKSAKAEKIKRERLAKKAKQLHAKGKSFRAIGKQLGVSAITAARYCKK